MPAFPFTSPALDSENFVEDIAIDPTIRTSFDNGVVLTRKRFTTVPKRWNVGYRFLPNSDKISITTFYNTTVNYGADTFTWTNPVDATTPTVRFESDPRYKLENDGQNTWRVSFALIEVP